MTDTPTPIDDQQITVMAEVGKTHGLKGWNKLNIFSDALDALTHYERCLMKPKNGHWREITLTNTHIHGNKLLAHIDNTTTPEEAKAYIGNLIGVFKKDLPPLKDGTYYHHQLENLTVIDQKGTELGVLKQIWSNGAHDVFEVKGEQTHLLPYIESVIEKVDLTEGYLYVNWTHED